MGTALSDILKHYLLALDYPSLESEKINHVRPSPISTHISRRSPIEAL